MRTEYFITMDTHCRTTDVCIKTAGGKLVRREHLSTGIPQLREVIESVPRPRRVAFEEGSWPAGCTGTSSPLPMS